MQYISHAELVEHVRASKHGKRTVAVIAAADTHTLEAVMEGVREDLVEPILFGDAASIERLLRGLGAEVGRYDIRHADTLENAALQAGLCIKEGHAHFLMKGGIPTGVMLKALFHESTGFRTGNLISHVAVTWIPNYHKLVTLTDSAINVYPTLEQKAAITLNAVNIMRRMGFDRPNVAFLAAAEDVNPKIIETVEARTLRDMARRGELGDCEAEGPISYDLAMSGESAASKKFDSPVAGNADLLVSPNITAANVLVKALRVSAGARTAGLVVGGRVPIALSSRGAAARDKFLPVALAAAATL